MKYSMQNKLIHGWYIFSVYLLLAPFVAKKENKDPVWNYSDNVL